METNYDEKSKLILMKNHINRFWWTIYWPDGEPYP